MRTLVLGANGMAGHVVTQYLRDQGHDVDALAKTPKVFVDTVVCDVRDIDVLSRAVKGGGYDYVVNCLGLLIGPSGQRHADAAFINGYLPHFLAETLSATSTRLVHLSTDCVFAGTAGPYAPDRPYDGQRFYDRSKALGEVVNDRDLTVRMSIIGPELKTDGSGLFHWFANQSGTVRGFSRALWNGVTTIELARALERLMGAEASGLVQLASPEHLSKYDLLCLLDEVFDAGLEIVSDDSVEVDKRLIPSPRLPTRVSNYSEMALEMRDWIRVHSSWYSHYGDLMAGMSL